MKAVNFKNGMYVLAWMILVQSASAQIYNVSNLSNLLSQSKTDSLKKIERLAAFKFHRIINAYRKKNRLDTISWDEGLWLTCRNHNIWMSTNAELSHSERTNTKYFFGISPSERYEFTTLKKGTCYWSAENALYNYSAVGNTIDKIATEIATTSFEQWKQSPGHNTNMLGKNHVVHGVAFFIHNETEVWATDLFSFNTDGQFNNMPNSKAVIKIDTSKVIQVAVMQKHIIPIERTVKIDVQKVETELLHKLYELKNDKELVSLKKNKAMEKAAHNHSLYMSYTKKLTHTECNGKNNFYGKTEENRMIKATRGLYFFQKHKTKLVECIVLFETSSKNFDIDKTASEIQSLLNSAIALDENSKQIGYGLSIRQSKNNLKFYVTRLIGKSNV
jgi:uncharacterized protein YkwD